MMHTSHVIAMYLQEFFNVWNSYCVYPLQSKWVEHIEYDCELLLQETKVKAENEKDPETKEKLRNKMKEIEKIIQDNNFCSVISKAVEKRRYKN